MLVCLVYVGIHVAEPYFRFYQYRDAAKQEARFASLRPDEKIKQTLWSAADSLALPEAAYHIRIKRMPRVIRIQTAYEDSWTVGPYTRPVDFYLYVEQGL